jgi:hypothetical protein
MAFIMAHSAFGTNFDQSYWRPVQVNLGIADQNAHIIFYGYASAQARADGQAPIDQRHYPLTATQVTQLLDAAGTATGASTFWKLAKKMAYTLAGELDGFFEGASSDA